MLVNRLSDS